jgi:hypothetical protein
MNKAALLADLASKYFIENVSAPTLLETKPNGTKWYQVNINEIVNNVGTFRNVNFYVANEGQGGETAFYQDAPPSQSARLSVLDQWMLDVIDSAPDSFRGFQVLWKSERYGMVIYAILVGTSTLTWKYYYARKDITPAVEITGMDLNTLRSILSV